MSVQANICTLPAIMDLDAIDQIRDQLLAAMDMGNVTVDASGVERVATNCVLLLLSAAATAQQSGVEISISGGSDVLHEAVTRLGLTDQFVPILAEESR